MLLDTSGTSARYSHAHRVHRRLQQTRSRSGCRMSPRPRGRVRCASRQPRRSYATLLLTMSSFMGPPDLWTQQRLDGAAFVHGAVAFCHLVEGQGQIENLAGVDLPVPHLLDELGQETAHRGGAAVEV